eukprot:Skav206285  [mRNA]  locus=scaffold922:267209:273009:- [translate_table: standard]
MMVGATIAAWWRATTASLRRKVNITIGEKAEARAKGEELKLSTLVRSSWNLWRRREPSDEEGQWLKDNFGESTSKCLFLYTGSVNETNAADYAQLPDVDGFVVGRAGLEVEKLSSICRTLVKAKGA